MDDLISRQEAIKGIRLSCIGESQVPIVEIKAIAYINRIPAGRKGEWVDDVAYYDEEGCPCILSRCNRCGEVSPISKFCPNCGADMRGEQ